MRQAPTTRDQILDAAERMIRAAGYNGFSTRDVADAVGIKAASVHYHFPTKIDIGVAVAERYTDQFIEKLGDPRGFKGASAKPVKHYTAAFRRALVQERKLCLCAVLGAERQGLPTEVVAKTRTFFEKNLNWLQEALRASGKLTAVEAKRRAALVLAAVEGAMIVSQSVEDDKLFEFVAESLVSALR